MVARAATALLLAAVAALLAATPTAAARAAKQQRAPPGVNTIEPASAAPPLSPAAARGGTAGKPPTSPALSDLVTALTRSRAASSPLPPAVASCLASSVGRGDSILADDEGRMPGQPWDDYLMRTLLERHPGGVRLAACLTAANAVAEATWADAGARLMWAALSSLGMSGQGSPIGWLVSVYERSPAPFGFTLGGPLLGDGGAAEGGEGARAAAAATAGGGAHADMSVYGVSPDGFGVLHKALDRDKRALDVSLILGATLLAADTPAPPVAGAPSADATPAPPPTTPEGMYLTGIGALFEGYGLSVGPAARDAVASAAAALTHPQDVTLPAALLLPPDAVSGASPAGQPPTVHVGRRVPAAAISELHNALASWGYSTLLPNVLNRRAGAVMAAGGATAMTAAAAEARARGAPAAAPAAFRGAPHLAQLLGSRDRLGRTALHMAALTGNAAAVDLTLAGLTAAMSRTPQDGSPRPSELDDGNDATWWPHLLRLPWLTDVFGYTPRALAEASGRDAVAAALATLELGVATLARLRAREGCYTLPHGVCVGREPGGAGGLDFHPAAPGPLGVTAPPAIPAPCPVALAPPAPVVGEGEGDTVADILARAARAAAPAADGGSAPVDDAEAARAYLAERRQRNRARGSAAKAARPSAAEAAAGIEGVGDDDEAPASTPPGDAAPYVFSGADMAAPYNEGVRGGGASARVASPPRRPYSSSLRGATDAGGVPSDAWPLVRRALGWLPPLDAAAPHAAPPTCDVDVIDVAALGGDGAGGAMAALRARFLADGVVPARPILLRGLLRSPLAAPRGAAEGSATAGDLLAPARLATGPLAKLNVRAGALPLARRLGLPDLRVTLAAYVTALAACGLGEGEPAAWDAPRDFNASRLCPLLAVRHSAAASNASTGGGGRKASPSSHRSAYAASLDAAAGRLWVQQRVPLPGNRGGGAPPTGASPSALGGLLRAIVEPLAFALDATVPVWRGPLGAPSAAARVGPDGSQSSPPRARPRELPLVSLAGGEGGEPPAVFLFAGGAGSGPQLSLNLAAPDADRLWGVAHGAAHVLLRPPADAWLSTVPIADELALLREWRASGERAGAAAPLYCGAEEGDVLYVPRGWAAGAAFAAGGVTTGFQVDFVTPFARY